MALTKSFTCSICKKHFKTSDSMLLHKEFCSGRVAMYSSPKFFPRTCRSKRKLIHKEFSSGVSPIPMSKICTPSVKSSTFAISLPGTSTCDFSSLHITASEASSSSVMLLTSSIPSITSSTFSSGFVPLHPAPENHHPTNIPLTSSIPSITPITLPSVFPPFYPTSNVTVVPYTSSVVPYTSSVVPYTSSVVSYTSSVVPDTLSVVPFASSISPLIPSAFSSEFISLYPTTETFTSSVTPSTGSFKFAALAPTSGTYLANNDDQKIENIWELSLTTVGNENAHHVAFETEVTHVEVSSLVGEHEHALFSKSPRDHNISTSNTCLDRLSLSPNKNTQVLFQSLTPTNVNQEHENVEQIFEGTKNENVNYVSFDTENSNTEAISSAQEHVIKHASVGKCSKDLTGPESNIFSSSSTDGSNDPTTAINSDVTDGGDKRESILQSDTDIRKSNAQSSCRRKKSTSRLLETLFTPDQRVSLTMETTNTTESCKSDRISPVHSLNEFSKITFGAPATDAHEFSGMVADSVSNRKVSDRYSLENDSDTPCSDRKKFRACSFKNDDNMNDVHVEAGIISSSDHPNSRSYSIGELCALSMKCSQECERNEVKTPLHEPISSHYNDDEFCSEQISFLQSNDNQNKRFGNTELLSSSTKCSQESERNEVKTPLYEPISPPCNDDEFCSEPSSFLQSNENQNKRIGNTENTELLSLSTKCSQESERNEVKTPLYEPISSPCNDDEEFVSELGYSMQLTDNQNKRVENDELLSLSMKCSKESEIIKVKNPLYETISSPCNDDEFFSEPSPFLPSTNNQNKCIGNTENSELSMKYPQESEIIKVKNPLYETFSFPCNDDEFYPEQSSLLPSTDNQTFAEGTTNFMDQKKKEHDLEKDSDMLPSSDLWKFPTDPFEGATQFVPVEEIWNNRVMVSQNSAPVFGGAVNFNEPEQNSAQNQQAAVSSDIEQIRSADNRLESDKNVLEDSGNIADEVMASLWFLDS